MPQHLYIAKPPGVTSTEVYAEFFAYKYERDKTRSYSKSSIGATKAAALHGMTFRSIKTEDLQAVVDSCPKKLSLTCR